MFTTFQGLTPSSLTEQETPPPPKQRVKRSQVQRACNFCRLNRVKCDNDRPCRTCKQHGRRCIDGQHDFRSLPAALEEIDRLRARLQDLEVKEKEPSPITTTVECSPKPKPSEWKGMWVDSLYYGPSSLHYYLNRMYNFLQAVGHAPYVEFTRNMLPPTVRPENGTVAPDDLTKSQQDFMIDLYWMWYHPIYPIIDEDEFGKIYKALWPASSDSTRLTSPLVDIVLALCIQYSATYNQHGSDGEDSLDGLFFYQRCHAMLNKTLEIPSLMTVQCYALSILYLVNAGLSNQAQTLTAQAIRMATILGLNDERAADETDAQKEISRRVWWFLYAMDIQVGVDLGRQWLVCPSMMTCNLPSDASSLASIQLSSFARFESGTSWLAFQRIALNLTETVRKVYTNFYTECDRVIGELNAPDFYADSPARESCAKVLIEQMKMLNDWRQSVPAALKVPRQSGESLSTDRCRLDLDPTVPVWFQRQRILLELQYHYYCVNLCRSFISFSSSPALGTPLCGCNAITCLKHAMAIVSIMHQVLTDTDLLNGWYTSFYWLKSASLAVIGFTCGYPVCPPTPSARKAAATSIEAFEMYGEHHKEAQQVAADIRQLLKSSEMVFNRFCSGLASSSLGTTPSLTSSEGTPCHSGESLQELTPATTPAVTAEAPIDPALSQPDLFSGIEATVDYQWMDWDPTSGPWAPYVQDFSSWSTGPTT